MEQRQRDLVTNHRRRCLDMLGTYSCGRVYANEVLCHGRKSRCTFDAHAERAGEKASVLVQGAAKCFSVHAGRVGTSPSPDELIVFVFRNGEA